MTTEEIVNLQEWWASRRLKYNTGLLLAGIIAFVLYCALGPIIIAPHEEFEETIFEIAFQGGMYFFYDAIGKSFLYAWADNRPIF